MKKVARDTQTCPKPLPGRTGGGDKSCEVGETIAYSLRNSRSFEKKTIGVGAFFRKKEGQWGMFLGLGGMMKRPERYGRGYGRH